MSELKGFVEIKLPDGRYFEVHVTQLPAPYATDQQQKDWIDYRGPDIATARHIAAKWNRGFTFGDRTLAQVFECVEQSAGLDWFGKRPLTEDGE